MTNVIRSLNLAVNLDHKDIIWYDSGRLTRIMLIFEPFEVEDPEDDWFYQNNIDDVPTEDIDDNYQTDATE